MKYIHERQNWTDFSWDWREIAPVLAAVHQKEGVLLGKLSFMDARSRDELMLNALSGELQKSYEIEGETLDLAKVRSSFANRLDINIKDGVYTGREIDDFVSILADAVENHSAELTKERLFGWHVKMFAGGRGSGVSRILAGEYRKNEMQVVSGRLGHEKIHFHAPAASAVDGEMQVFLRYVNGNGKQDPVIKAIIAHLWFVTIKTGFDSP